MAGKLTALGRLIALIALPGQYRLVTKDRVIPVGFKIVPDDAIIVPEGSHPHKNPRKKQTPIEKVDNVKLQVLSQEEAAAEMNKINWCPDCGGVEGRCNCSI